MVHPAPLMMNAPAAKMPNKAGSGMGAPGGDASPRLQPQGQNNSHDPIGLSILISFKYGCRPVGALSTQKAMFFFLGVHVDSKSLWFLLTGIPP